MDQVAAQDRVQSATAIFRAMISARAADKYQAIELLSNSTETIELPTLRTLLIRAIKKDYYSGKETEDQDSSVAKIRSWLLAALARVATGDEEATALVARHVDAKAEPYAWARYWSLVGLIQARNDEAKAVAKLAIADEEPLVALLATAHLASLKDKAAAHKILKALEEPSTQWCALRALRIVPLPAAVKTLSELVKGAGYTDETYDAIIALGKVPSDGSQAMGAAQALSECVTKLRDSPWKDGMRTGAIAGLGNLKIESSGPLLLEELVDDNPAIVREAARAMEKILGLRVCVIRIVEAASKPNAAGIDVFGRALRWLDREAVAEELETLMQSGSTRQQDVARALLSELGGAVAFEKLRARTDVMKQYSDVLEKAEEKIRALFETSVREAQSGFHLAVIMDVIVFAVGVVLLLGSAGYALYSQGDIGSWAGVGVTGGVGVLGMVYGVLIANPRRQVRESVDHLMRVKMVFLAYLRRLHQADQAYARRLLDDEPITVDQVKGFSETVGEIMKETVRQNLYGGAIVGDASHESDGNSTAPKKDA
jgi:HEAT repeat protein